MAFVILIWLPRGVEKSDPAYLFQVFGGISSLWQGQLRPTLLFLSFTLLLDVEILSLPKAAIFKEKKECFQTQKTFTLNLKALNHICGLE